MTLSLTSTVYVQVPKKTQEGKRDDANEKRGRQTKRSGGKKINGWTEQLYAQCL